MLQHVSSGCYLSNLVGGQLRCWKAHASALIVEIITILIVCRLIQHPDESILFELCPSYKASQPGDILLAEQPFSLLAQNTGLFLGLSTLLPLAGNTHKHVSAVHLAKSRVEPTNLCCEVWATYDHSTPGMIKGGSLIQLKYFEFDAFLCLKDDQVRG